MLLHKPGEVGNGTSNSLFLQIFNKQKFNIQAIKSCLKRELTHEALKKSQGTKHLRALPNALHFCLEISIIEVLEYIQRRAT